jgi:hypothetical protein
MADIRPIVWIHSYKTIELLRKFLESASEEESIKKDYDKTKEAWIAAMYLIYKMYKDGTDWYIRKNDIENSIDDIYARSFHIENKVPMSYKKLNLQITRLTEYDKNSLMDLIKRKIKGDLRGTNLVIYIMRDEYLDWKEINKELHKLKPQLEAVGIVGRINNHNYIVGEVYPNVDNVPIDTMNLKSQKMSSILEARQVLSSERTGLDKEKGKVWLSVKLDVTK